MQLSFEPYMMYIYIYTILYRVSNCLSWKSADTEMSHCYSLQEVDKIYQSKVRLQKNWKRKQI